jgi:hypothetical protein
MLMIERLLLAKETFMTKLSVTLGALTWALWISSPSTVEADQCICTFTNGNQTCTNLIVYCSAEAWVKA